MGVGRPKTDDKVFLVPVTKLVAFAVASTSKETFEQARARLQSDGFLVGDVHGEIYDFEAAKPGTMLQVLELVGKATYAILRAGGKDG